MDEYYNATEAAEVMGLSPRTVSDLCKEDMLEGAVKLGDWGPWQIPKASVNEWLRRSKRRSIWKRIVGLLPQIAVLSVVGIVFAGISALADWPQAQETLAQIGIFRPFQPAHDEETLVIIAPFYVPGDIDASEPHREIKRRIEKVATELEYTDFRIELWPVPLRSDEKDKATKIGNRYNATIVIWGEDSAVRMSAYFLNLKFPGAESFLAERTETYATRLSNPSEYSQYVTHRLPADMQFFAFQALANVHIAQSDYENAILALEKSIDSAVGLTSEQIANIYGKIAGIHIFELRDFSKAEIALSRAIDFSPNAAIYYNERGVLNAYRQRYESALRDFSKAISLSPSDADYYYNRATTYMELDKLQDAATDFTQALEIEPTHYAALTNRALLWADMGQLEISIAEFTRLIELFPDSAHVYRNRAGTRLQSGDHQGALADYSKAIDLEPKNPSAYYYRALVYREIGDDLRAEVDLATFSRLLDEDQGSDSLKDLLQDETLVQPAQP